MPDKANLEMLKFNIEKNNWLLNPPEIRISWKFNILWINIPAHKNNKDLKSAWVNKWKKLIFQIL